MARKKKEKHAARKAAEYKTEGIFNEKTYSDKALANVNH
jgi:hypothetical protein